MEAFLWILKWVVGPIVAAIVTLLVSEPLKNWLAPVVTKLGSKKEEGITGTWKATFFYGTAETPYVEVLKLSSLLGQIVGHVVPHDLNHSNLKAVEKSSPLRLRGSLRDNRFFTGVWFHPSKISHHHGAFKILVNTNNAQMKGIWLGYSETSNTIESGRWEWERL